ncbi:MAG: N-acetylneuraminate synthase family protein [Nitrospirae bacterium]|nr:N-acetylneuraminate synthase family protein [Nitrospirota bacterium]
MESPIGRVTIKIANRLIGDGEPCFVMAEAGSNHNGNFEQALRLIDAAVEAGADAVKFQNFKAARLYPRNAGRSDYLKLEKSIYDIIHEMEMPESWVPRLAEYCRARGILFLSSAFDEASVDLIEPFVPAFKIASYEMTHYPLIEHIVRKGKPMILSTGCADLVEVGDVVDFIRGLGRTDLILLQCTAKYPAPVETLNVRALPAIRDATGCLVGLSDHSRDPVTGPAAAVALGACVVEKHFTLSNRLPGPDHGFALTPEDLKRMVRAIRDTEAALGTGEKIHSAVEDELRLFARRSVFAVRPVARGEAFTRENIAVLRNGKNRAGLPPSEYPRLLGRVAACPLAEGEPVSRRAVVKGRQ